MLRLTLLRTVQRPSTRLFTTCKILASPAGPSSSTPSQIAAHVKWVAGAGKEILGSVVSEDMKRSGQCTKQASVEQMRAAKAVGDKKVEQNMDASGPMKLSAEGRSEGLLGKITGCEGMKERGNAKLERARKKIDEF